MEGILAAIGAVVVILFRLGCDRFAETRTFEAHGRESRGYSRRPT